MTAEIRLDGLLFSDDAKVVGVMNQILNTFSIQAEVCNQLDTALDAVRHRRLDAVIVDWDVVHDPTSIVRAARKSSPNSNSTIVALVNKGSETHALLVGANFMIHKPADLEHASRCMRAAYGTMLQNRRRAARVAVDIPVDATISGLGTVAARISDLSIGGFALQCKHPLQVDLDVLARFVLPGSKRSIDISGKVVNANATGRAGVKFSLIREEDLEALESWLAAELAKIERVEMPSDYVSNTTH